MCGCSSGCSSILVVVAGVGSALAYSPSIVTVGQYFERRRTLANGLSVAGSGVGNFAIPPLIRLCVDRFGLSGALLILSAIMLHVCLAGALLRPPAVSSSRCCCCCCSCWFSCSSSS